MDNKDRPTSMSNANLLALDSAKGSSSSTDLIVPLHSIASGPRVIGALAAVYCRSQKTRIALPEGEV